MGADGMALSCGSQLISEGGFGNNLTLTMGQMMGEVAVKSQNSSELIIF